LPALLGVAALDVDLAKGLRRGDMAVSLCDFGTFDAFAAFLSRAGSSGRPSAVKRLIAFTHGAF
jgi:hypothetical protein